MKIANSSAELLRVKIDDILSYYEVETKTFKPSFSVFNVRHNCLMLESLFLPLVNSNKVKLRFFVEESTPKYVVHDSGRIRGIMINLIGNSIKYTKMGVVSVIISWADETKSLDGKNRIKVCISDSGCGILESKKKSLFKMLDPDNLVSNSEPNTSTTQLAGTGLSVSQRIAMELGSKLQFKSAEGNGTSFWFELNIKDFQYEEDSHDSAQIGIL